MSAEPIPPPLDPQRIRDLESALAVVPADVVGRVLAALAQGWEPSQGCLTIRLDKGRRGTSVHLTHEAPVRGRNG